MKLKGFDKFREKVPVLKGPRIIILPLYVLFMVFLTFYYLNKIYFLPQLLSNQVPDYLLPFIPLFGVIVAEVIGFMLVGQMWFWKDYLKKKYGSSSYQRIFLVGFAGILITISLAFNVFTEIQLYSQNIWQKSDYSYLITSLYSIFPSSIDNLVHQVQIILGLALLLFGLSISMRSVLTFGFDYTTVVYLYFPEESKIKENQIYSALRHPMYSGIILVAFAGFIYNVTIYSFLFFIIYLLGFYAHIHFVEEPELVTRFGESFLAYRKNIPPFFLNPLKFKKVLKFVIQS